METLYRFKSDIAASIFKINCYPEHNKEMGKVLEEAKTFSLIPEDVGYIAFKNGVELRTERERVYITREEFSKFFEQVPEDKIEAVETDIERFDKAVETVNSVIGIDSRTAAIIKLVRFEFSNRG